MASAEALCCVLRSFIEVTEALCMSIDSNEFSLLSEALDEREKLLRRQSKLTTEWENLTLPENERQHGILRLQPLVEDLKQLDKKIIMLLEQKKILFAEKMKQAQNEKRLLAYSR